MDDLMDLIINSATPKYPERSGLTPGEELAVEKMVKESMRPYVQKLATSKDSRIDFEFDATLSKALGVGIRYELFPNNKAKISAALKLAKQLLADWELLIQQSELFSLLRTTAKSLEQESQQHSR